MYFDLNDLSRGVFHIDISLFEYSSYIMRLLYLCRIMFSDKLRDFR